MMKEEIPGVTFEEQQKDEKEIEEQNEEEEEEPVDEFNEIIYKGETLVSKVRRKVTFFLTNITIEPVMLFYGCIRSIDYIAQSQLTIGRLTLLMQIDFAPYSDKLSLFDAIRVVSQLSHLYFIEC